MCFSAEASFGASAVIGIIGIIALKKATNFPQKVFAIIPIFFAVQQFLEGMLWLVLDGKLYMSWKQPLILGFLFFAWLVWPVYIPFSMAMFEKNRIKRKVLLSFLGLGFLIILGFLYVIIFHNIDANAAKLHINYTYDYVPPLPWIYGLLYLIPTIVSFMLSSVKKMWALGLINLTSYIFSRIFFFGHVLSVWCFFGAVASVFILWYIIQLNKIEVHQEDEYGVNQTT